MCAWVCGWCGADMPRLESIAKMTLFLSRHVPRSFTNPSSYYTHKQPTHPPHTQGEMVPASTGNRRRGRVVVRPLLALALLFACAEGWVRPPTIRAAAAAAASSARRRRGHVQCNGGVGVGRVGERYSWRETEWELEVCVPVPATTRKEDVLFKASTTSLKLGLANTTELLMGGQLKGRIALDGTYWSLEGEGPERAVKLLLEKKDGALENSMDWRRVLAEEPATEAQYEEAERFDTQAYVHQMLGPEGVNMSLVDKEMFGGLAGGVMANVSRDTLKDYVEAKVLDDASGLFKENGKRCAQGGARLEEEQEEGEGGEGWEAATENRE